MTNREIKNELKNVYQPPLPQRKHDFLKSVRPYSVSDSHKEMSIPEFLLSQVQYIRPWCWLLSLIAFTTALYVMDRLGNEAGWAISAMIPFVSASVLAELHRSVHYQMNELEQATRFSLKAVTYARITILGINNLLLLVLLSPCMVEMCQITPIEVFAYLLCPYAMTAFLGLYILRIWHSESNILACGGVSILVCLVCIFYEKFRFLIMPDCVYLLVTLTLVVLMVTEYKKYFSNLEELAWN